MTQWAVEVEGVSKSFRVYRERNQSLKIALMRGKRAEYEDFWALRDVSLQIPEGKTFGLMGDNGSGKSTLLKCIARILEPDSGNIRTHGSLAAMLELGSGFHPELTGRENVYLNGSILGMSRKEIDRKFDQIVDFAGIGPFIDQPVKNYSSGMYVRLGFSVAIHVDPDILLVDEILAVGDMAFQEKCKEKFADFKDQGKTVIVVSHGLGEMRTFCDEAAWLSHGKLVDQGLAALIVDKYIEAGHNARPVEGSNGVRHGSGEIQVEKVELLDTHSTDRRQFVTGDEVTVRLHWRATRPIERPVFSCSLSTLEGIHVWAHHTRDAEYIPTELRGNGTVDVVIPALPLQPGTFDFNTSVVDEGLTHSFDQWVRCARIDVLHGKPRESGGIVTLSSRWGNLTPPVEMAALPSDMATSEGRPPAERDGVHEAKVSTPTTSREDADSAENPAGASGPAVDPRAAADQGQTPSAASPR